MHGGRPHHSSHDALLTQILVFDIIQKKRQRGSIINMDATQCYDRIFSHLSVITMAWLGVPRNYMCAFAQTIHKMKHKVKQPMGSQKAAFPTT